MTIDERQEGTAVIVSPVGRLDAAGAPALEGKVSALARHGVRRVVLDCRGVAYINSAGLRVLLVSAKACHQAGGRLTIAALGPQCRSIMYASGLLSILGSHETVEEALAAPDRAVDAGCGWPTPRARRGIAIEERSEGAAIVLSLNGRLDGPSATILEGRIATIVDRGGVRVVLDCSGMSYINSVGLRALLLCARTCHEEGGKLVIAALTSDCRSVVGMSGFLSIIDYHETREAAIAALA